MSIDLYWLISKINITIKTIMTLRFISFSTRYLELFKYFLRLKTEYHDEYYFSKENSTIPAYRSISEDSLEVI